MQKILLVKDNTELCGLLKPFLNAKGIELDYCQYLKQWSLKMTSWPTFRYFPDLAVNPQDHFHQRE